MITRTRTNRYPGTCGRCGARVPAETGQLLGTPGAWRTEHNEGQCQPVAAPDMTRGAGGEHAARTPLVGPGVYRHAGDIYLVVESRGQKDIPAADRRRYAKRLVTSAARLTEAEQVVNYEWDFEGGTIQSLAAADQVPLDDEEIHAIMIRYGRCLCGRPLRAAKSVARMIGPVCVKKFAA